MRKLGLLAILGMISAAALADGSDMAKVEENAPITSESPTSYKPIFKKCKGHIKQTPVWNDEAHGEELELKRRFYFYLAKVWIKSAVEHAELEKNIVDCLTEKRNLRKCGTANKILQEVPAKARWARKLLAMAPTAGRAPPSITSELTRPNFALRSQAMQSVESWEPASPAELKFATEQIKKQKKFIEQRLRETNKDNLSADWRVLSQSVMAARMKSLAEYYELIGKYPILLRLKTANPSREDIVTATIDAWESANEVPKRAGKILDLLQTRGEDTCVDHIEGCKEDRWQQFHSDASSLLFSDTQLVRYLVSGMPELCPVAEAYMKEYKMRNQLNGPVNMGGLLAITQANPAAGLAVATLTSVLDFASSSRELRRLEDRLRMKVYDEYSDGDEAQELEDVMAERHTILMMNTLGLMPMGKAPVAKAEKN